MMFYLPDINNTFRKDPKNVVFVHFSSKNTVFTFKLEGFAQRNISIK